MKSRKTKATYIIGVSVLLLAITFFLLRGPYLSNYIKRIIIPVLENVTRERVLIEKAVINLFPFYIQAKGLKVYDDSGNRLLWITKSRAYIDVIGILSKEIRIRKLSLKEPDVTAGERDIRRIVDNVRKKSPDNGSNGFRVNFRTIQINDGNFDLTDSEDKVRLTGAGIYLDMNPGRTELSHLQLKDLTVRLPNGAVVDGGMGLKVKLAGNVIEIVQADIRSSETHVNVGGDIELDAGGKLKAGRILGSARVDVDTLNRVFGLEGEKKGIVTFEGTARLISAAESPWPRINLDLKTGGDFYLETLMEILNVKENIAGHVEIDGTIRGTVPDIEASGVVRFSDTVLDTFELEEIRGNLGYKEKKLSLDGFTARAYDGTFTGDASLTLPHAEYSVDATGEGIDSPGLFRFLRWNAPFPPGRVAGDVRLIRRHKEGMTVTADLKYVNTAGNDGDVLDRLKTIQTGLTFGGSVLTLENSLFSTARSDLTLDGTIDFGRRRLDLSMDLKSTDVVDLSMPYYNNAAAPLFFSGKVSGTLDDPVIDGNLALEKGVVKGIPFSSGRAHLNYRIARLNVSDATVLQEGAQWNGSGVVEFRKAREFFSFQSPFYKGKLSIAGADLRPVLKSLVSDVSISGSLSGELSFEGDEGSFGGTAEVTLMDSGVFGQRVDEVRASGTFSQEGVSVHSLRARRGSSVLRGKGRIGFDKHFTIDLSSEGIEVKDIDVLETYPFDGRIALSARGTGTLDDPSLEYRMNVIDGRYEDVELGDSDIQGSMKGRKLQAIGRFLDGIVSANAKALLSDQVVWEGTVDFEKGSYDPLLFLFIREAPRDLSASLQGKVTASGRDSTYAARADFESVGLSAYGYNLRNEKTVSFEADNKVLKVLSFSMTGDNADIAVSGSMGMGKQHDLNLSGTVDLASLRSATDKLSTLEGRGEFFFDIKGPWEKPAVSGHVDIRDAAARLTDFPQKIGPLNGILHVKEDRIAFDNARCQFGGGMIVLSGSGQLENLAVKRMYVSSQLSDIRIRPVDGAVGFLDGRLFYEMSPEEKNLTGDLELKKMKYTKRVEWRSWLLGLKERQRKTAAYPAFLSDTQINVRISGQELLIDNNIAKTLVRTDLNVTGTESKFGVIGRIEADEGTVFFRSNEFKILEGSSIDFVEPNAITPFFHILAETYRNDYYVKLSMDGTLDQFSLALFSDPPLSDDEILSLLTFGQASKDARGFESGMAAGEATSLLMGGLKEQVEEEFGPIGGFERFEIEPHTTTEGAFTPRVTVGKRLLEDKVKVIYSGTLGTTEEQVIKVEYKLSQNISLVGSRNELGSAGVDFKYRLEFR